jgi:hypothetical protein
MRAIKVDHCGNRGHGLLLQEIRPTASLNHETDQPPHLTRSCNRSTAPPVGARHAREQGLSLRRSWF